MEDRIFESSRNVSIKLHHRIGRFVKIQLTFASKWIMLSEIMFESGKINYTSPQSIRVRSIAASSYLSIVWLGLTING